MAERFARHELMNMITNGAGNPGVIVGFAPADVPSLSIGEAQKRIEATKQGGATAVAGRLGTVRAIRQEIPGIGRLLVATNAPDRTQPTVLEQETGVTDAIAEGVHALGVGYFKHSDHAPQQRVLFRGIRGEVLAHGQEFPIFTFIYSGAFESPHEVASGVHDAAERGTDAVVVQQLMSEGDADIVAAGSLLQVPVYFHLSGKDRPFISVLNQAARARDIGAGGVVVGTLRSYKGEGDPTLSHMIKGIRDVVVDNKSPEDAHREATKSVV